MSLDALVSAVPAGAEGESESHAWLQLLLRSAMEQVMAAEGSAVQKANSLARLAGLYLKTCQMTELKQAQKQLAARVAELEDALASIEAANGERGPVAERLHGLAVEPGRADHPVTSSSAPARSHAPRGLALTVGSGEASRGAHPPARAPGHHRRR